VIRPAALAVRPTDETHRVTTLELFFDLVFVFAITQVTALMASDLGARGLLRGLVLLALLWWAWCSYAWLGNCARADEGLMRLTVVVAMGAMFIAALTIPEAWDDQAGGVQTPVVLAACIGFVRIVHIGAYLAVANAAGDAGLHRQMVRTGVPVVVAALVLLAGGWIGGPAQTALWSVALVIDYVGLYVTGTSGWRLPSPAHFAERFGLIVIVALGESIVAIGLGVSGLPLTWPVIAGALLGLTVAVTLWWTYFDVVALVAERVLAGKQGIARLRLARDSFTYLHFPMVAGIIYLALGLKKTLQYVGDTAGHSLSDPLPAAAGVALCGGVAVYLLGHLGFRLRNIGSLNRPRLVTAVLLVALLAGSTRIPALALLGVVATLLVGLVSYEAIRYGEGRRRIRDSSD
jgi:low temperature requirement protein LtrA